MSFHAAKCCYLLSAYARSVCPAHFQQRPPVHKSLPANWWPTDRHPSPSLDCLLDFQAGQFLIQLLYSTRRIEPAWPLLTRRFLARDSRPSLYTCYSALYAIARPFLLSHGWSSQKRLKLGSCNFHHRIATRL